MIYRGVSKQISHYHTQYMTKHGTPWSTTVYHNIQWYTMVYHGIPRYIMIHFHKGVNFVVPRKM